MSTEEVHQIFLCALDFIDEGALDKRVRLRSKASIGNLHWITLMEHRRKKIERVHRWLSGSESTRILRRMHQEEHEKDRVMYSEEKKGCTTHRNSLV